MFFSSVKVQLKVMIWKWEFQVAFLVTLFYACVAFVLSFLGMSGAEDIFECMDANQTICYSQYNILWMLFRMLYPFLIVLPFATSYVDDYKNGLLPVYVSRVSRWSYYGSKLLAAFIGTAVMIGVPFLINLLLCNLVLPHNYNTWYGAYQLEGYIRMFLGTGADFETVNRIKPFLEVYSVSPFLYNVVYLLLLSALSGLLGSLVMGFSFFFRKWKVVLFVPVFLLLQALQTWDRINYTRVAYGKGMYINYDPLSYVTPGYAIGHSGVYIFLFCLAVVGVTLLFLLYAVKREMKSIQ